MVKMVPTPEGFEIVVDQTISLLSPGVTLLYEWSDCNGRLEQGHLNCNVVNYECIVVVDPFDL
jgi:hypothetical protein